MIYRTAWLQISNIIYSYLLLSSILKISELGIFNIRYICKNHGGDSY